MTSVTASPAGVRDSKSPVAYPARAAPVTSKVGPAAVAPAAIAPSIAAQLATAPPPAAGSASVGGRVVMNPNGSTALTAPPPTYSYRFIPSTYPRGSRSFHLPSGGWYHRMRTPQVALPGFTRLAAAIQSESGSSIPSGGSTPLRMAHASRSRGVWQQQQLVQHCVAVAQPQCPLAHGYAWSMEKSSHAATCAELGKNPTDAAKNARMSTQTSHRYDRKMREDDTTSSMYRNSMPSQGEASHGTAIRPDTCAHRESSRIARVVVVSRAAMHERSPWSSRRRALRLRHAALDLGDGQALVGERSITRTRVPRGCARRTTAAPRAQSM